MLIFSTSAQLLYNSSVKKKLILNKEPSRILFIFASVEETDK